MVCVQKPSDSDDLVCGEIQHIIVDDVKYLSVELYSLESSFHYFAFEVCSTLFRIVPIVLHQV